MFKKWMIMFTMTAMAAMIVGAGSGHAAPIYWTGDGIDDNWDTNNNWSSDDDGNSTDPTVSVFLCK